MYRVLNKEEIEQGNKDRDEWWITLSDEWKLKLYDIFCTANSPDYITNPEKYMERGDKKNDQKS